MSGFRIGPEKMRASRLLSIMMLLQAKGRMSAEALAEELEVSVRTIYRDIDQLSAAGVPVYADIGRNGGFALLDGWRTRLTGLTAPEARALFLSGLPGPASELGLGDEVAAAELKLLAALPADWQTEATRMSSRFHLDPKGWFSAGPCPEFLKLVAEAVWSANRTGDRDLVALATLNHAEAIAGTGDLERAVRDAEAALAHFTSAGNAWRRVECLRVLGDMARQGGEPDAARAKYLEAEALARDIGAHLELALIEKRLADPDSDAAPSNATAPV